MAAAPLRWFATLALSAAVAFLALIPGEPTEAGGGFVWLVEATPKLLQKSAHVVVYALLAIAWAWTLERRLQRRSARLAAGILIAAAFGAILEWQQVGIPGRFGTLTDVLVNAVGAVAGGILARPRL